MVIGVTGKGGTGKTTFSALFIRHLLASGRKPVLAVDADANANLHEALGLEPARCLVDVLEEIQQEKKSLEAQVAFEAQLAGCLKRGGEVDLLVMGGPEGPGCYCYPHDILRGYLDRLAKEYPYVVVDSEAGLEHLSRRTIPWLDLLFILSDPTVKGMRAAAKIFALASSLGTLRGRAFLVVTKARNGLEALAAEIAAVGAPLLGTVPYDPEVASFDLAGKPLFSLPPSSPAAEGVRKIFLKVFEIS